MTGLGKIEVSRLVESWARGSQPRHNMDFRPATDGLGDKVANLPVRYLIQVISRPVTLPEVLCYDAHNVT